ncbi:formin-like protein 18 isoform X2 [Ricinus communis]|uniref:Formin-like protein n=1 Tax=Ricinus communis TaxID=3988 RepID=B9RNW2_RICCO|nr:formin-like protein 18 isoform X2 [Ricinus communis]EEF46880.1 DNA binding protein, putative [Ricinus communis]|eukprot:XP_002515431.1 formin-like protein 18 isoform X2 [Ricinus communis]
MALFRKFFYRKPPDGLLEISERVYVFDCCFTTEILDDDEYKIYIGGIVSQLRDQFPDSSFMVFNFREGEHQSLIGSILSEYDMTVMDYPRHYEGCPLLTMEMIHHFLRSSESWLSLLKQNVLLMHCERGGWPVLAFMLASLLIYRKQFSGEQKTLDMIYKQAPRELLQLMSPLNPLPSQLRYLQYVSRRNVGSQWPPLDRALTLDCVILRVIPNMDGEGGCRPIFRIYGQDPLMAADRTPKVLFSTPKRSKLVRHYKQAVSDLIKLDIHCHVQGDVVMECIHVESDLEREQMIFRVMFNTAFIRSNILMLNSEEIDMLWNVKDQFPKDFRAEVLFSEMHSTSSLATVDLLGLEEKGGLPEDAFAKVQEFFSNVDLLEPESDLTLNLLQQFSRLQENLEIDSSQRVEIDRVMPESTIEKVQGKSNQKESKYNFILSIKSPSDASSTREKSESQELMIASQSMPSPKPSPDVNIIQKRVESSQELHVSLQRSAQSKIISPRVQKTLRSSPYSTSSAIGISALLHDDGASNGEEITRQVTITSSAISSPVTNVHKPMQLSHVSNVRLPPSPPPLPPSPSSTSLQCLKEALTTSVQFCATNSPPQRTSKATYSSANDSPEELSETGLSLLRSARPPRLTSSPGSSSSLASGSSSTLPPPPPPPSFSGESSLPAVEKSISTPLLPPLSFPRTSPSFAIKPPPAPPLPGVLSIAPSSVSSQQHINNSEVISKPSPPPPPPLCSQSLLGPAGVTLVPSPPPPPTSTVSVASVSPPPPLPSSAPTDSSAHIPPVPPPPAPCAKGLSKPGGTSSPSHNGVVNGNVPPVPGPPSGALFSAKGRGLSRSSPRNQAQPRKANLKPYHWLKITRAMQGSLWAEAQKSDEASKTPEFDMSELESLFSAAAPNTGHGSTGEKSSRRTLGSKSDKVQLIELRRAYNCEIMLSKVKIPLSDLMSAILAMDDSVLDVDQVDNLIKFCPTKEEMELLKGYSGDKDNLGKCEQFFLELMKVPRVESKLRVFSFKLQFHPQVSDLRRNLNVVNSAAEEVRSSRKLKRIMQTILSLGNALNHGTARGSAVGFRLDSLLKLTDTRAINNKMTLMHYLCKVLAEKLPELLDFQKDLMSLEAATKIQLKYLAEEMQAISKGLEKVLQELTASENDGHVSEYFCKSLKVFLSSAESEVRSLASLYSTVGRNADALALYFGEDPARCPFEQVVSTLLNFVKMFIRAHDENCKQLELVRKRAEKEAENEKLKMDASKKESVNLIQTPIKSGIIK